MRTEARRSFRDGFVLTETELRRLVDEISEQMQQICLGNDFSVSYEIKFMNGAVAEPASIDDITSEENHGTGRISRIKIGATADNLEKTSINVTFVDPAEERDRGETSISYSVEADSKDWVFVTSSKIEERIDKVKRKSLLPFLKERGILIPTFMLIGMFVGLISGSNRKSKALEHVEEKIRSGEITDPILALLEIQRTQLGTGWFGMSTEMTMLAIMTFLFVFVVALVSFLSYAYPAYNFCWGDYTEVYKRRKLLGNTVLSTVFLAFAVGIAANYISRFIP
jgi:hypothetical protein